MIGSVDAKPDRDMQKSASYSCAYCGEIIEIAIDPSAGSSQEYVEDCWVCCRPNTLTIELAPSGDVSVAAEPES